MSDRRELKRRTFSGEKLGTEVVRWLNAEGVASRGRNSRNSRQRILDLISTIQKLVQLGDAARAANRQLMFYPNRQERSLLNELEVRLSKYKTYLSASFDCDNRPFVGDAIRTGVIPPGEWAAVDAVMELHADGLLDRIRKCICGRWFFARFRSQVSCSSNCRHKAYEKTAEFKEKRRAYMRRYYRVKTSGKVK